MEWEVLLCDAFEKEFQNLSDPVREEIFAMICLLEEFGHTLARPHVDTLNGSKYANMKELRFKADNGVWRVAFAFDPKRQAILLVAGDKSGMSQKLFYKRLIDRADKRFGEWLEDGKG